jgi:predicted RNase H-like HicB family nuclease
MNKYEVGIYWSEQDHPFVAEVPDLPGCAPHGATQQAAVGSAQAAIRLGSGSHSVMDRHSQGNVAIRFQYPKAA